MTDPMADAPDPRLLVTLRSREGLAAAIDRALPGLDWASAEAAKPERWGAVEAMLVGAPEREVPTFDAASTPRLSFVQRVYTGVDGFPFDRFPAAVRIAGNVGAFAPFVAEHAVALALAAARLLPESWERVRTGRLRPPLPHRLLFGRTAVVLGFGEIGREIAGRLHGFGMRVLGVNRTGRMAAGADGMYPAERLLEAVAEGDFLFDARPLTRATRGSLGREALAAMRPAAVLVNVGRAGTIDEEALYRHLASHPEFRAGLDVWWTEDFGGGTLTHRFPFGELPNLVGSPHVAGFGDGVEGYVLDRALANLARYFRGEPPLYVVDRSEYTPA